MVHITDNMESLNEELKGAKHYIKCAIKYKPTQPQRAKMYYDMANDELKHAGYFHDMVMKDTEGERENNEYAKVMWDRVHNDYVEMTAKIKILMQMYEGK